MKNLIFLIVPIFLFSCSSEVKQDNQTSTDSSTIIQEEHRPHDTVPGVDTTTNPQDTTSTKTYANARFKDVAVQKVGDHKYRITGKGQIFEASFNWVVEDGHEEIAQGHEMTDAGAPEWGNFDFTIDVPKKRANSSLTLIIFEISAKDGSRVHELPIPLK